MPIAFDRSMCCDLNETISREWLVTNGLGGYAAGTVAGVLTRMQHGLLVAAPADSSIPQLLLAKIDEEIVFDERTYYLGTNEFRDGTLSPGGFAHLETFRLEEGFPVFTYHLGGIDGITLEKRIWMPHGYNTTYIQYRVLRRRAGAHPGKDGPAYENPGRNARVEGTRNRGLARNYGYSGYPEAAQRVLSLKLLPFSAYRVHNQPQRGNNDWHFQVHVHSSESLPLSRAPARGVLSRDDASRAPARDAPTDDGPLMLPAGVAGCTMRAWDGAASYSIFAVGHPDSQATFIPTGVWYWHILRRHEQAAGRPATDDLYLPGVIRATLWPGEDAALTIIVTAEELSSQTFNPDQLNLSYKRSVVAQNELVSDFLQPHRYFGEGGAYWDMPSPPEVVHTRNAFWAATGGQAQEGAIHQVPTTSSDVGIDDEDYLRLLLQAADRFVMHRAFPHDEREAFERLFFNAPEHLPLIVSDYYGLEVSTRDMLIALPGLTLVTKRYDEAQRMLRILARYFQQGLLPDRLPSPERPLEDRDYGSVDTTLWYFYALDQYVQATRDYELLDDLYQRLAESIDCYIQGTCHGIQVDASDGLLRASEPGKALTWMNATVYGVPVTPRQGKPVEVNALWYHALSLMYEWAQRQQRMECRSIGDMTGINAATSKCRISHAPSYYQERAARCKQSFQLRFRYTVGGYLYDVIDGPDGDDTSLRPNQLLALSLRYPLLAKEYRQAVFTLVTQQLVTPYGLRTLAPREAEYRGRLKQDQEEQQRALHQGSSWSWLIGPYIDAMFSLEDSQQADIWQEGRTVLEPFRQQLSTGLLGMVGGVYDGDAPQQVGYNVASALGVAEILRVHNLFVQQQGRHANDLLNRNRVSSSSRRAASASSSSERPTSIKDNYRVTPDNNT